LKKGLRKLIVVISLVVVLAIAVPLATGCTGGSAPEPACWQ